jgi:hypothetical protein
LEVSRIQDPMRALEGQMLERFNQAMANANLSGLDVVQNAQANAVIAAAQGAGQAIGPVLIGTLEKMQQRATLPVTVADLARGTGIPIGGAVAPGDRQQLQDAIDAIRVLAQEQANLQRRPINVQAPAARPKEAPLPAEFAP